MRKNGKLGHRTVNSSPPITNLKVMKDGKHSIASMVVMLQMK